MLVSGFPPDRERILRVAKLVKYLPEYGWLPIILAPHRRRTQCTEGSPGGCLVVKRVVRLPTPSTMTSEIFGRLKRLTRRPVSNAAGEEQSGARLRIVSAVRQVLLWGDTPDAFAGWIPFAVIQGWRLARKWRPRVIYASGPPFSVVCAAGVLCRLLAIPLVADFRDPWTLDASDPIGMLSGKFSARQTVRRVKLLRKLEKWILAHSAAVLFTSDETRKLYVRQYPGVEGKSFVIYNGADSDDF